MLATTRTHARGSAPARGFTLIELMIVVVVVAILAVIALPAYQSQVRKARRADAVTALAAVQSAQERFRANNPGYTTALTTALPAGLGLTTINSAPGRRYDISITAATGTGYTVQAAATVAGGQTADTGCATLVVTVTNGNGANTPTACWSQ